MREIKFRFFDKESKQLSRGYTLDELRKIFSGDFGNTGVKAWFGFNWSKLIKSQSTGLKDKNGKEIFEGDILFNKGILVGVIEFGEYRCKNQSNHDRQLPHVGWFLKEKHIRGDGVSWYEDVSLEYLFWNLQDNYSTKKREDQNWVEIKGNKFENPELLESKQSGRKGK